MIEMFALAIALALEARTACNQWVQLGQDIIGEGKSQGTPVSISSDGLVIAIGTPFSNNFKGLTQIYRFDDTSKKWTRRGNIISGEANNDQSGYSVSLSSDGNTVAIGAKNNDGADGSLPNRGHVRIFDWNETAYNWTQRGGNIDGEAESDESGASVSLSSDGDTVAIGAPKNDGQNGAKPDSGHVRIFDWKSAGYWQQRGGDTNIEGKRNVDNSGNSVSLWNDGNSVAIGAFKNDGIGTSNTGHVRIYDWNLTANDWEQRGLDINGDFYNEFSGESVSLSNNGNTVAVGGTGYSGPNSSKTNSGRVRIFDWNSTAGGHWGQRGGDIDGTDKNDRFGGSVSLSNDGNIIAIGAKYFENPVHSGPNSNSVKIFEWNESDRVWALRGNTIPGGGVLKKAGASVMLSSNGNMVVIAEVLYRHDTTHTSLEGRVRVFKYDGCTPPPPPPPPLPPRTNSGASTVNKAVAATATALVVQFGI